MGKSTWKDVSKWALCSDQSVEEDLNNQEDNMRHSVATT